MKKDDFELLLKSVGESGQILKGRRKASREFTFQPSDIKKIRASLRLTQEQFAQMIGVSVGTLRNWEQGRRMPEGPARALLLVAAKNPRAVAEALNMAS